MNSSPPNPPSGQSVQQRAVGSPRSPRSYVQCYIFAYNPKGIINAHGGDPKLVGEDFTNVQDPDGKYFAREFIKIGPEGGWVDYKWMNYATKKVNAKRTNLKRIDDVIKGGGAYK